MNITDFEIKEINNELHVKYIGSDTKIDKCLTILNSKFPLYHLIKCLIKINESN